MPDRTPDPRLLSPETLARYDAEFDAWEQEALDLLDGNPTIPLAMLGQALTSAADRWCFMVVHVAALEEMMTRWMEKVAAFEHTTVLPLLDAEIDEARWWLERVAMPSEDATR